MLLALFRSDTSMAFPSSEVGPLLCGEHMPGILPPERSRAWRSLNPSGVREYCGGLPVFMPSLTKERELLPLAVDHVFQEDGLPLAQGLLVLGSQLHVADFLRDADFPVLRIVSCVLRSAGHLVQRDERGEQGSCRCVFMSSTRMVMPFAEHLELASGESLYASQASAAFESPGPSG